MQFPTDCRFSQCDCGRNFRILLLYQTFCRFFPERHIHILKRIFILQFINRSRISEGDQNLQRCVQVLRELDYCEFPGSDKLLYELYVQWLLQTPFTVSYGVICGISCECQCICKHSIIWVYYPYWWSVWEHLCSCKPV